MKICIDPPSPPMQICIDPPNPRYQGLGGVDANLHRSHGLGGSMQICMDPPNPRYQGLGGGRCKFASTPQS